MSPFDLRRLEHEADIDLCGDATDDGRARRRADLLVRVGDVRDARERQRTLLAASATQRVDARQQAGLHVVDARAVGAFSSSAVYGRSCGVPSGKTVSRWPINSACPSPLPPSSTRRSVSPSCSLGSTRDLGAESRHWPPRTNDRPRRRRPCCTSRSRCSRAARGRRDSRAAGLGGRRSSARARIGDGRHG